MGGRGSFGSKQNIQDNRVKFVKEGKEVTKGAYTERDNSTETSSSAMFAEFKQWDAGLTKEQIKAIAAYSNGSYISMNDHLWSDGKTHASEFDKKYIKDLNSAYNHALSKEYTVFRGAGIRDSAVYSELTTTTGGIFKSKGFLSSSLSKATAQSWASTKSNPVVFTIRMPRGYKNAAFVQGHSLHSGEREVVLKSGSNFRIVKQLAPKNGIPHVLLEAI